VLTAKLLPDHIIGNTLQTGNLQSSNKSLKKYGKSVESSLIKNYLKKYGGNVDLVAKELGISRSTLYRRLKNK
jgi:transcriptional regulator with PAS, ATPase and Fis domain